MAHYYINPDYQNHPPNYYSYDDQPYYSDHQNNHNHNYNYTSSSYVDDQWGYGGYSNEQYPVRYDQYQYYDSQFHSNPYQHLPSKSLIVYHNYNSAGSDNHPEFPSQKGSNLVDPDFSTGFVVSYSETAPNTDLDFEDYDLETFQGGYDMAETYGKPLPPSEEICYPPTKSDLTPPPPSPFGKVDKIPDTPAVNDPQNEDEEDEDYGSDSEEDEDEEEDDEEEEEEGQEQDNHGGVLIAPPLPGKVDQKTDQNGAQLANGSFVNEKARKEEQPLKPQQEKEEDEEEEEEEDEDEEEEEELEEEEEEKRVSWDDGRVEEKEIRRQIPPGYGLEALDLCEGVFGGYFPCLRKRNNQGNAADQGGSNIVSYSSGDANGDCWNTTMDYLFGDPDPYARAMPDPIYGYQRYYPQQPISEQVQYGGDTWSTNSSYYYGYSNNGGGY